MDSTEWLFEQLADHVCTVPIDSPTLDHLRTRVSDLEALITVHSLLEHTAVQLRESAPLKSGAQKKVEKFLDLIYNDFDRLHCEKPERVYKLRSLDYGTFLLITASCTPIDLIKITDHVFQHVIKNAPKYLERHTLPRKWMFRKEFQMAIVGKAHLAGITEFKRKYHELEFSMDPLDDEEPRRRVCIGSGRGDPSPAGLPDVSSGGNHPQSSRGQENTSRPCAYQIGDTIDPTDSTDQMEQGTKDRGQTGLPGSPMTNSIAEQENQKRLMTDGEEQEHALKRHQTWRYGSSRSGSAMEEEASEEYRKQLSGLEEEKKKRLLMARKERERMGQAPNTTSTSPIQVRQMAQGTPRNQTIPSESSQSESLRRHALEEYEIQLRLLEDQKRIIENQKRKR